MRALLITLGSHGDTHPFFALAQALQRHGHEAIVLTNPHFARQAARAGVTVEPIAEEVDIKEIMQTPGVMDPMKGARIVLRDLTLPLVPTIYQRTLETIDAFKPEVCIAHPICLGAPWAAEKRDVPLVSGGLAPIMWMNPNDRIRFGPWRSENPSLLGVRFDIWFGRAMMRFMLDGGLNRVRRDLGLSKRKHLLVSEFQRTGLNLGLWSPVFRPPTRGDPTGAVVCGFPWFDSHHDHQHEDEELDQFLVGGEAPIVFTMGTAAVHAPGRFYHHAIEACRSMKRRAILLMGRQEYIDEIGQLPPDIRAFKYAPFSTLLPRAALTVHHGGIGSTAQSLRSGRPSVIVPLAHDQFDNAARAKRLGVSKTIPHRKVTAQAFRSVIEGVLGEPAYAQRAGALGRSLASEDGAEIAACELGKAFKPESRVSPRVGQL
jgi:UDP:flavonoid glycosyltransferase YjiC (YdhE family)